MEYNPLILSYAVKWLFLAFVCFTIIGLILKFYIRLCAIFSLPLYAGMIILEMIASGFGIFRAPRIFCFNGHKMERRDKINMDVFASFSAGLGIIVITPAYHRPIDYVNGFLYEKGALLIGVFNIALLIVYIINYRAPRDNDDPMVKLDNLRLPDMY
jgi:hypothetical protein